MPLLDVLIHLQVTDFCVMWVVNMHIVSHSQASFIVQGCYRFQYKHPTQKGLVQFTALTCSGTYHGSDGC